MSGQEVDHHDRYFADDIGEIEVFEVRFGFGAGGLNVLDLEGGEAKAFLGGFCVDVGCFPQAKPECNCAISDEFD